MRYFRPCIGDKRTITYFAWFPIELAREVRWLERVSVCQEYAQTSRGEAWISRRFADRT